MEWPLSFISVYLNEPLSFLIVLPVIAVIIWQLRRKLVTESIMVSGLEYMLEGGLRIAADKKRYRIILLAILTLLIGFAWTAPEIRTSRPLLFGPIQELGPTFLVAFDVSGSMTDPLGGYVVEGKLNLDGVTRFEASREGLYSYIDNFPATRFGIILFSVQPLLVRLPSIDNEFKFRDILDEGLTYTNPTRQRPSQLSRFAGGTNTIEGLKVAGNVLTNQKASTKSLLLIGDLIDNAHEIIEGMREINLDDVYLHIMAIDPEANNLEMLMVEFNSYPNVHIYPVLVPSDVGTAFSQMIAVENDRLIQAGGQTYLLDIRWLIYLLAFAVAAITVILYETKLHKTYR